MLPVAGRPFIEWPLRQLRTNGFRQVVICVGYHGEVIRDHLGTGASLGLEIAYSDDGAEPLGTLGAIRAALPLLGDRVPVLYADTYLEVEFAAVVRSQAAEAVRHTASMTMTVIKDAGRWGAANCIVRDDHVVAYSKTPPPANAEWLDYGFSVIEREALEYDDDVVPADLTAMVGRLAQLGAIRAWPVDEPFREIGTPSALAATDAILRERQAIG